MHRLADQRGHGLEELHCRRRELARSPIHEVDGADHFFAVTNRDDGQGGKAEFHAVAAVARALFRRQAVEPCDGVVAAIRAVGGQQGTVGLLEGLRNRADAAAVVPVERQPVLQLDELRLEARPGRVGNLALLVGNADAQGLAPGPLAHDFHHRFKVVAGRGLLGKERQQGAGEVPPPLGLFALGDVARGGKHALHLTRRIAIDRGVVEHVGGPARGVANGKRVIPHQSLGEDPSVTFLRLVRLGEVVREVGAHQALARYAGHLLGRPVDVGDLALRADGHERLQAGLDQAAGIERGGVQFGGALGDALLQLVIRLLQRGPGALALHGHGNLVRDRLHQGKVLAGETGASAGAE